MTQKSYGRVFAIPVVLAVLTAVGLLSALIGDSAWDVLSWLSLAVPLAVVAWFLIRHRVPGQRRGKL